MNAYAETDPDIQYELQDECNEMPGWVGWLWWVTMLLMPAAAGLMTGMLENGWLPETFRVMLNYADNDDKDSDNDDNTDDNKSDNLDDNKSDNKSDNNSDNNSDNKSDNKSDSTDDNNSDKEKNE